MDDSKLVLWYIESKAVLLQNKNAHVQIKSFGGHYTYMGIAGVGKSVVAQ
jgi:hypothetical protein